MITVSKSQKYLLAIFNSISPLSAELQDKLSAAFVEVSAKKNDLLIVEGQVCNHAWLLIDGLARSFSTSEDQKESTGRIMGAGYFITSVISWYEQVPAIETIEVLEKSFLLRISHTDLQKIYADFPEFNYHARVLTEKYVVLMSKREVMLRKNDAKERYSLFSKYFDKLLNTVPLKFLASFTRMERATFTKIKNNKYD